MTPIQWVGVVAGAVVALAVVLVVVVNGVLA